MSEIITEEMILKAKTPEEYIDLSLQSDLPSGRKSVIAKEWMTKTGFTVEDIKYARHRHEYWKGKKLEGNAERNEKRFKEHDHSSFDRIKWDEAIIKKFLENNDRKDYELAAMFQTSIPGIQHLRRKINMIQKSGIKPDDIRFIGYMMMSENILRSRLKKKGISTKRG